MLFLNIEQNEELRELLRGVVPNECVFLTWTGDSATKYTWLGNIIKKAFVCLGRNNI